MAPSDKERVGEAVVLRREHPFVVKREEGGEGVPGISYWSRPFIAVALSYADGSDVKIKSFQDEVPKSYKSIPYQKYCRTDKLTRQSHHTP